MLISTSHHFIFIATPKAASTTIESRLKPHCEIAINETRFGKHLGLSQLVDRYAWIFEEVPLSRFFIFSVMRDPVDFMLSFYNSHCHPSFLDEPDGVFTGKMSFTEFLQKWTASSPEQVRPQHERMLDKDGNVGVDFVISYEKLRQGLEIVGEIIRLGPIQDLEIENESFGKLRRRDLRRDNLDWIRRTYQEDILFRRQFCDRMLSRSPRMRTWRNSTISPLAVHS
jgi:hypothetical protein